MGCGDSKQGIKPGMEKVGDIETKGECMGTLHYFNGHGRAEFIRLMLWKRGVNFVDHRIEQDDWDNNLKPANFSPGGLPAWEETPKNGQTPMKMNETNAVARFLAKQMGYHPKDPKQAWDVDAAFDYLYGMWPAFAGPTTYAMTDEKTLENYVAKCEAVMMKMSEKLTKQKTTWICGN